MTQRQVSRIVRGMAASDGAGVRLRRSLGQSDGARLDPFLMLDEIVSDEADDYIAGFPPHPHRGFETVTYMIEGRMRHRDHLGNNGLLVGGGAQWMTAGRGIIHSEMPEQESGRLHGFQLWINLPAAQKMRAPRYQDIEPERIPEIALAGGGMLRLIVGVWENQSGPVEDVATEPFFGDLRLPAGSVHEHPLPADRNAFFYVYRGSVTVGDDGSGLSRVEAGHAAILGDGDTLRLTADEDAGLLLLAARPVNEPVVQYGPFVMNSREEIETAIRDYQSGRLGAESVEGASV